MADWSHLRCFLSPEDESMKKGMRHSSICSTTSTKNLKANTSQLFECSDTYVYGVRDTTKETKESLGNNLCNKFEGIKKKVKAITTAPIPQYTSDKGASNSLTNDLDTAFHTAMERTRQVMQMNEKYETFSTNWMMKLSQYNISSVSYTHLTLPTIYSV
eukprot:TRINITY_DN7798_c0_g1_i5.p1 TRINITY_DN7798_c0_g1~~TRINITY_DN7798_c0_g1_i5.p1  ORF type:complete len:159 (+),score=9.90 TRINITY_DN7798_c0_g1_i5:65-541(+)